LSSGATVDYPKSHAARWSALELAVCPEISTSMSIAVIEGNGRGTLPAGAGNPDCVQALIDAKADVNQEDDCGYTPLLMAAAGGHSQCVSELLSARANVTARDPKGRTALELAVWGERKAAASRGGSLRLFGTQKNEETVYAHGGYVDCLTLLIRGGADVNAKDDSGMIPLMEAALNGNKECIKALIAAGADLHAMNKSGKTALQLAKTADVTAILQGAGS